MESLNSITIQAFFVTSPYHPWGIHHGLRAITCTPNTTTMSTPSITLPSPGIGSACCPDCNGSGIYYDANTDTNCPCACSYPPGGFQPSSRMAPAEETEERPSYEELSRANEALVRDIQDMNIARAEAERRRERTTEALNDAVERAAFAYQEKHALLEELKLIAEIAEEDGYYGSTPTDKWEELPRLQSAYIQGRARRAAKDAENAVLFAESERKRQSFRPVK